MPRLPPLKYTTDHIVSLLKHFIRKVLTRLNKHDDVITPLLRGAPCLSLALGPATARAGRDWI